MVQEFQKFTLQDAISNMIWNLWSSSQSKFKCSPIEKQFNGKPNTIWKQLASDKPSNKILDKGKLILCKERAKDSNADDRMEDGYKYTVIPKKNQTSLEKGYESDNPSPSKPSSSRLPLQSPFKGKILWKTNKNINKNPFYKELTQKILNISSTTVKLSD